MLRLLPVALLTLSFADTVSIKAPRLEPSCVRLEGAQIGQLPLTVQVGAQRVEFLEWKAIDTSATELIGFTAQAADEVRFSVEAGRQKFDATANWLHPAGVVGPRVKPITALTVCAG